MKDNIKKYFHQNYKDKLERELGYLGQEEIDWIISDVLEVNSDGGNFKITSMKFNSDNRTINLDLRDDSSEKSINRDLIL